MSDDHKYTYSIRTYTAPREAQVRSTQRMGVKRGYFPNAPLDVEGATYHRIFDESNPSRDPVGLIECADGSVFTYEDLRGMWDPKDAEVELIESAVEALEAVESDFFARQLADIDKDIYTWRERMSSQVDAAIARVGTPPPTWRERLRAWVGALRYRLGSWIAGMPLGDDEEWDDEGDDE